MQRLLRRTRRICVLTGSRAEYGLLRYVMKRLEEEPAFELQVLVTGAHLSATYGNTCLEIEADGFSSLTRVDMGLAGDDPVSVSEAAGRGLAGIARALAELRPDLLMLLGDRYEILAAATAATIARIPIAHLAGGDITEGAFDDAIRHALTKLAHLHFPTNEPAAARLLQMGEDPRYVHVVGSTAIDAIRSLTRLTRPEIEQELGVPLRERNVLVTFHPVTLDPVPSAVQLAQLLTALESMGPDLGVFFTGANADPEGLQLNKIVRRWTDTHPHAHFYASLGQIRYLSLLAQMDALVGNSSSGIYDAPALGVPTVNVGLRQAGRLSASSVIDCSSDASAIASALQRALANPRRTGDTPYGDGHAAERIVAALMAVPDFSALLCKRFVSCDSASVARSPN